MLFFTKLAKMAIKISKSNLQSSNFSFLPDQPKEINWLLIFYTKKTTTKKTSKFPNMTVHSQWNGSPGTPALQVDNSLTCPLVCRVFLVRWSRYNPYYLEPEVRKEAYSTPETELSAEEKEQRELKAIRPIKAATGGVSSSVFSDPVLR